MANKKSKYKSNISGKYYVDKSCIACAVCTGIATEFFTMDDDEGHAYLSRQPEPENKEDNLLCIEAMEACPVSAIGDDGN